MESIVEMAMAVLLPLLMAYNLIGEKAHEWMGTMMICLFIFHHALNYRWYGVLFHGRYNITRILNTAVNFLLLVDMLLMGISGIMMSAHVFSFLNISEGASVARSIHLPCAFWGFLLMSFHLGLNWQAVLSRFKAFRHGKSNGKFLIFMRILIIFMSAYGIYAFFRRHFPNYLFLKTQFMFFDYSEALAFYLFDIIAIMLLFAVLGHYCVKLLTKTGKKRKKEMSQ